MKNFAIARLIVGSRFTIMPPMKRVVSRDSYESLLVAAGKHNIRSVKPDGGMFLVELHELRIDDPAVARPDDMQIESSVAEWTKISAEAEDARKRMYAHWVSKMPAIGDRVQDVADAMSAARLLADITGRPSLVIAPSGVVKSVINVTELPIVYPVLIRNFGPWIVGSDNSDNYKEFINAY